MTFEEAVPAFGGATFDQNQRHGVGDDLHSLRGGRETHRETDRSAQRAAREKGFQPGVIRERSLTDSASQVLVPVVPAGPGLLPP